MNERNQVSLTDDERSWRLENIGKDQRTERNVRTLPAEWKYHLHTM